MTLTDGQSAANARVQPAMAHVMTHQPKQQIAKVNRYAFTISITSKTTKAVTKMCQRLFGYFIVRVFVCVYCAGATHAASLNNTHSHTKEHTCMYVQVYVSLRNEANFCIWIHFFFSKFRISLFNLHVDFCLSSFTYVCMCLWARCFRNVN